MNGSVDDCNKRSSWFNSKSHFVLSFFWKTIMKEVIQLLIWTFYFWHLLFVLIRWSSLPRRRRGGVGHHLHCPKISTDFNHIVFQSTRLLLFNLCWLKLSTDFNLNEFLSLLFSINIVYCLHWIQSILWNISIVFRSPA